jgi:cell filamentation protein
MYQAEPDPYCYPNSSVLKNRAHLRSQAELDEFEAAMTFARAEEPLPAGRSSITHYKAIHHHLFQDVYSWAGKYRTVRLTKGASTFCYPEHIAREMKRIFSWLKNERHLKQRSAGEFFAGAAHFLAELNAVHPFREGNGRAQLTFLALFRAMLAIRSILSGSIRIRCLSR